jgi:putative acetyltransferase
VPQEAFTLRRATPADAAEFARVNSHPDVQPNLMQLPYGNAERWKQVLAENDQPGRTDFVLVAERDGRMLGNAGLHPVGHAVRRRHVAALGISVAADAQGQGVGRALMQALVRLRRPVGADPADRTDRLCRQRARHQALPRHGLRARRPAPGVRVAPRGVHRRALCMARLHPQPPRWVKRRPATHLQ